MAIASRTRNRQGRAAILAMARLYMKLADRAATPAKGAYRSASKRQPGRARRASRAPA
jgi:hypothetical protein